MLKILMLSFFLYSSAASAQWAVYDKSVEEQLKMINKVASAGEKKLSEFDAQTLLSAKFEAVTIKDKTKYIGTVEDCGDDKLNPNHYTACQGLRNLRLKTLEQSEALLEKIKARRTEIKNLVTEARNIPNESGQMQRYHFELQGLQAHMQNDAMQLEVLRDGYKQREKMYEMQIAEARRATDTRAPGALVNLGPVPFIKPPK
jgi:hypothetical protein